MKRLCTLLLALLILLTLVGCADVDPAGESGLQTILNNELGSSGPQASPIVPATEIPIQELVFHSSDFDLSAGNNLTLLPDGLGQTAGSLESSYESALVEAPIPFNALVPQWIATIPEDSELELSLRTGSSAAALGEWMPIHAVQDWMRPGELDTVGEMLIVPEDEGTHTVVQYRVILRRASTAVEPRLEELRLVFIDSTAGPDSEELILQQQALNESLGIDQGLLDEGTAANPKPFVISRDVWCTHPSCDYSDGLAYEPVTHLILHHTVSSSTGDSAAVVRAIWAYHTFTRDWGDIGYNFLVDTAGVLYEGHLGGDDVVGIHAAGANAGSMALALIGTYSVTQPPEPMLNSVVDLFSWKAEQRNIDVLDASDTLPNIDWGLPNLMGHRDVYGTTECPGDTAHRLLPLVRESVAGRTGLESPYFYVDERSDAFTKSETNWYEGPLQCGHNAHSWYTFSTTSAAASVNWGVWRPLIPESSRYEIQVYVPYCNTGRPETSGATYAITHADGISEVVVNQNERVGLWTSLGEFNLRAGRENEIRLTDLTKSDSGLGVWFDAVRLRSLEAIPTVTLGNPSDGDSVASRTIDFSWSIENPDKVKATILQVATDDQFVDRVANPVWAEPTESSTVSFDKDYPALYWRVVVTSQSNQTYPSPVNRFVLDSEPPVSAVEALRWLPFNGRYRVLWAGSDAGSGIAGYTIEFRLQDEGDEAPWQLWLENVSATAALFTPTDPDLVYEFRSRATDNLGNMEPARETADITTDQADVLGETAVFPVIIGGS